jgi:phytol kinase
LCRCGFEPEENEDLSTPWEWQEKYAVFGMTAFFGLLCCIFSLVHAAAPEVFPWMAPPYSLPEMIIRCLIGITFFWGIIMTPLGICVVQCGMPVGISRKTVHIFLYIGLPLVVRSGMLGEGFYKSDKEQNEFNEANGNTLEGLYANMFKAMVWDNFVSCFMWFVVVKPVRRLPYLGVWPRTAFTAIDRPEDRPCTILFLKLQTIAAIGIVVPLQYWSFYNEIGLLGAMPAFAIGLGDGLAEPIGKRFGKHKYTTKALFGTDKEFTRSYEGSANVWFWTLMGVLYASPELNIAQIIFLAILLPPVMTFTEAKSPHTCDNPFMVGVGWIFAAIALQMK